MVIVGVAASAIDETSNRIVFGTFKDMIPFLIAIPAAWLSYCIQRRAAYLQQLRSLWSKLIDAVQTAVQYTYKTQPSQEDFAVTLVKISIAIEEIRGLFKNLGETEHNSGLYPFEPLKDIYGQLLELGHSDTFARDNAKVVRKRIFALWKDVRREFLREFEREEPTFPHSHWADIAKTGVYHEHEIPKKPT